MAGVYFHTIDEAVKEAKSRAQSHYATYYVYQAAREKPNLFCSKKPPTQWPIEVKAKVLFDGSTVYFGDVEDENNGGA